MQAGQRNWLLGAALVALAGCATTEAQLEKTLLADRHPTAHTNDLDARYTVRCPDVLELHVSGRTGSTGPYPVGPDGRITLSAGRVLRVDGLTAPEIATAVARRMGVAEDQVRIRVAEF